jgi:hypothetical protein
MDFLIKIISKLRLKKAAYFPASFNKPNIYIIGYPISGNTWISFMISYALNAKLKNIDAKELDLSRIHLKKYLIGKNEHSGSDKFEYIFKSHCTIKDLKIKKEDKVVYISRDVRDVANSYFWRMENTYNRNNYDFSNNKKIFSSIKNITSLEFRRKILIRIFGYEWKDHVETHLNNNKIVFLKFENFLDNPKRELNKLISIIDRKCNNSKVIDEAIDIFSKKNMKNKDIMLSQSPDRVGTSKDWKNYFTPKDTIYFDKKYRNILTRIDNE